jgi:hypothetical protein
VAGFVRNRWPLSIGLGGRFRSESVAALARIPHKVNKRYRGKLQTEIENMDLPNPVIRSHYRNGFIKQYVRDHIMLRTEAASNDVNDYGVKKAVENLPVLQKALSAINDNYLNVQQDILETFVDRGQLRKLAEPTITSTGKRIPGLKLDHPRQLALMHALVRFSHIAAGNSFTTTEIHPAVIEALGCAPEHYPLASLRYDLSKLRAKGLVAKLPNSRRYQLLPQGYSICLVFLKLRPERCHVYRTSRSADSGDLSWLN